MEQVVGAIGGDSAGGRSVEVRLADGGKWGAGSGQGGEGSEPVVAEPGIWSNRTHPVRPYPSQFEASSGGSKSGQHSQSIASSRKSSVILLKSQYVRMTC